MARAPKHSHSTPSVQQVAAAQGRLRKAFREHAPEMIRLCDVVVDAVTRLSQLNKKIFAQDTKGHAFFASPGMDRAISLNMISDNDANKIVDDMTSARLFVEEMFGCAKEHKRLRDQRKLPVP